MSTPTVFLSAATVDLSTWRDVLHGAFSRAGFHVLTQKHSFGAATRDVKQLLCRHIDESHCVIHLAGLGYGSHADEPFPSHPGFQCSWTQFEYYYAHSKKKEVIAFVCAPNLSAAGFVETGDDAERALKEKLQQAHRKRVASGKFEETPLAALPQTSNEPVDTVEMLLQAVAGAIGTLMRPAQQRLQVELDRALSLHQLPPLPVNFVGRDDELEKLRVLNPGAGAIISGLRGMGGIGKSALGVVLAHEWKERFPDAQFFLDARGTQASPPSAGDLLAQVIQTYHPLAKLPEDEAALQGLYHQLLADKRVLVLVDNAKDAAQVAPLVPPEGCGLIVTSRQNFLIGGVAPLFVGKLPNDQAITLLRKYYPALSDADAAALAALCAGLPLALKLAGSQLSLDASERDGLANVTGYIHKLRSGRLATLDANAPDAAEVTISETLRLSEEMLSVEDRIAWRKLGIFTTSFDAAAAEAVAGATDEMLNRWVRRSLLERDSQSAGPDRYQLHDLATDYARQHLTTTGQLDAAYLAHAEHYAAVANETSDLYKQKGSTLAGLDLFDRERLQLEAAFTWLASRTEAPSQRTLLNLINGVAYTGNLLFHPHQRITWLEAQLTTARHLNDQQEEGIALGNLGLAYYALGEPRRAIEYHEQALVVLRKIGDRRGEGATLGSLGLAYAALGEPRRAIEFHEQALIISREIGDRRGEGSDLGNLGNAYAALGEPRRAIKFHKQYLDISREIGDRQGEGNALGNLGNAYADLGEPRRAIEYYEQQLIISREIGGRRGEGNSLGNLGNAYAALGEPRRAIEYYEQALIISREIGDRRGEGNSLFNWADELWKLGDHAAAITNAEAALEILIAIESPHADAVREQLAEWKK
ncbi:MAG: tetratricopeptide repeat protein [Planctomycetaceae bacterium]